MYSNVRPRLGDRERKLVRLLVRLLAYRETLELAARQAKSQLKKCAGEHKDAWADVLDSVQYQIWETDRDIARHMGLAKYSRQEEGGMKQ